MTLYHVTAERTPKWWVLQAIEAPGAISQVARLDQADQIIEAIAFVTGTPESDIEITVEPVIPDAARAHIDAAARLREESQAANRQAAIEARAAARALQENHLPLRDIGTILGVSYQRAHQLVQEPALH